MDRNLRQLTISPNSYPAEHLNFIMQGRGVEPQYRKQLLSVLCYFLAAQPLKGGGKCWLALPETCCYAVGGQQLYSTAISSAWLYLWLAAHLLDIVEDEEDDHPLMVEYGSPILANMAAGFIFSASALLDHNENWGIEMEAWLDITAAFRTYPLRMAGGQLLDLTVKYPGLQGCLKAAELKSGEFFALACYAGARMASDDPVTLEHFSAFGRQLGIIRQIKDDLEGIQLDGNTKSDLENGKITIPIAFALENLPEGKRTWLSQLLKSDAISASDRRTGVKIVQESGALMYCLLEIEKCKAKAVDLLAAVPDSQARKDLTDFL